MDTGVPPKSPQRMVPRFCARDGILSLTPTMNNFQEIANFVWSIADEILVYGMDQAAGK